MRKRLMFGSGLVLLALLITLVVWQGSFTFGPFVPSSLEQTYAFWAVSTLVFILTVTLGFMLFRTGVKLYIERRSNRTGSHIRSKLVGGALALSILPVFFLVLFSVSVLNRNIDKWFSYPAQGIRSNLTDVGNAVDREFQQRLEAEGHWLLSLPAADQAWFCAMRGLERAEILLPNGIRQILCASRSTTTAPLMTARVSIPTGTLLVSARVPVDLAAKQAEITRAVRHYDQLSVDKKGTRNLYLLLLSLITLFILFFATWIAMFLSRQISVPITALLAAAKQVRRGNLGYRVHVAAIDELAGLVKAFNEMTEALETNSTELEVRRRFTEAILESIPSGVVSLAADGSIQRVNRALMGIFPEEQVRNAKRLDDLFSPEDAAEVRYLMNRARRTGVAGTQLEYKLERRVLHLSITVAALDPKSSSGYVLVLEDSSDLLRAQKAAAWHEVARRVAHEIKNPLTPIALCADRIARQLDRSVPQAEKERIYRECSTIIAREVQSVKALVDEFSEFSRFPAAHPVLSDLNDVIRKALDVFAGRLDGIAIETRLANGLPQVSVDREQFKRVLINLIDNAAEAMEHSTQKQILIVTQLTTADSVELVVSDTGAGISREDKEKLFLPYFSTKNRGTGLGLAIVNHILNDHDAVVRVEDNVPEGARFVIDIPAPPGVEPEMHAAEVRA